MDFILIVDDSKTITNSLKILINEELGYHAVIAHSKKECADVLLKYRGKFSAALLDLNLPDAPNGEVVDFVTKFNIPTIVLTGTEIESNEDIFRDKNIIDYVCPKLIIFRNTNTIYTYVYKSELFFGI